MKNIEKEVQEAAYEKSKVRLKIIGSTKPMQLAGKFWFSNRQRLELDNIGYHRMFAKMFDGRVLEYTEMCEYKDILDDPTYSCEYEDAIYLGEGIFMHFVDL